MKTFSYALALLSLLAGCEPEVPPGMVCLGGLSSHDACQDRVCLEQVQRITREGSVYCDSCNPSTPDGYVGYYHYFRYRSDDLVLDIRFNHQPGLDWSLDTLRAQADTVSGWYESPQGRIQIAETPFEVVSFEDKKLRVRFTAEVTEIHYVTASLPYPCFPMGTPATCIKASCAYDMHSSGADGVPGELVVDLTAQTNIGL